MVIQSGFFIEFKVKDLSKKTQYKKFKLFDDEQYKKFMMSIGDSKLFLLYMLTGMWFMITIKFIHPGV